MVYGIAKMLNFAHGDVIMIGAYVVYDRNEAGMGLPIWVAILLSIIILYSDWCSDRACSVSTTA